MAASELNFQVKRLGRENLPFLFQIEKASNPSPWTMKQFEEEFENPNSIIFGIFEGTQLRGFTALRKINDEIEILEVAIEPDQRRRGLAYRLLDKILTDLSNSAIKADLEVRKENQAAISLYQKLGFSEVGRRSQYYKNPTDDAILMTKQLP